MEQELQFMVLKDFMIMGVRFLILLQHFKMIIIMERLNYMVKIQI